MASKRLIRQAGIDNTRQHRIGETDGFTPEQARDLGFTPDAEEVERIANTMSDEARAEAERHRLADPELDAEWQARRQNIAPVTGGLTIAEAQVNAARHVARHREIRGAERRAANRHNQD